jgi:ubiquinone/menaquinone biosynthesis C-methylase UbiE
MKNRLLGNEVERMPDFTFRMMKILFAVFYFFKPVRKYLHTFGIKPGTIVVDYGCGTGAFISETSKMVGANGTVYAVDIHEMAIASAVSVIRKHNLTNVKTILTDGNSCSLPHETADLIYAIDMFHMVKDTDLFLKELHRITKKNGILIIEDGHQPRALSKEKILISGYWKITGEEKRNMRCTPVKQVI